MAAQNPPPLPIPPEVLALARAIRFALVCILLGLCYLNIRTALSIDTFGLVYKDMLGNRKLPALPAFILQFRSELIWSSIVIPVCAVASLFSNRVTRSFYALGILALFTFLEMIILLYALFSGFGMILQALGGDPSR